MKVLKSRGVLTTCSYASFEKFTVLLVCLGLNINYCMNRIPLNIFNLHM